jgi:hypothetical protein
MGKIIITIILVNIEITIIQTTIFEFESMLYLFSMSLPKKTNWELWNFALKKYTKWSKRKCSIMKWYADMYPAVLPFLQNIK